MGVGEKGAATHKEGEGRAMAAEEGEEDGRGAIGGITGVKTGTLIPRIKNIFRRKPLGGRAKGRKTEIRKGKE